MKDSIDARRIGSGIATSMMLGLTPLRMVGQQSEDEVRQRINLLNEETEKVSRGLYGDPWNRHPGVLGRLEEIEKCIDELKESLDASSRQTLYWRIGQTSLLVLILIVLFGVAI